MPYAWQRTCEKVEINSGKWGNPGHYDNSTDAPNLIAYKEYDKLEIFDHETFSRILKEMGE